MMSDPTEQDAAPAGPYATAAATYWSAGWKGCLPVPYGRKTPVPTGYTGTNGAWPSYPDVHAWTEQRGADNIALRLPPDVLGIDVDQYDAKPGGLVLADLEQRLGALPATWRTTSRDDGISGIRLYRIPAGLRWPGVLGPGIETIRHEHRYALAWPSTHPKGGTYRWITPSGAVAINTVPAIDELPALPATWVEHFTKGETATDQPRADLTQGAAHEWLRVRGHGTHCRHMTSALTKGLLDLHAGGSRHDAALSLTNRLVWLAGEGHQGATAALRQAGDAFLGAVAGDRPGGDAAAEFERMVSGAVAISAAAHPELSDDPCETFGGLTPRKDHACPAPPPSSDLPKHSTNSSDAVPLLGSTNSQHPSPGTSSQMTPAKPTGEPLSSASMASSQQQLSATDNADLALILALDAKTQSDTLQELARQRASRAVRRHLEELDPDAEIADRVRRRLIDDKAATAYRLATEPAAPPFDAGTLTEILARPDEPPMRVEGLIPWDASTLVVAQRKTGKTTLMLNYARALLTGEDLLGEFPVLPIPDDARVAMLNFEVSGATIARWAHEARVPADRLYIVNLRGRRNPLPHPEDRALLAQTLRDLNVHAVIVDPFGRAYTGASQNDNGEVQAFLVDLDVFVRSEVGATDLMLAAHAGWDGERSRGASALEDWADVIITLTRDAENESKRFMKAMGRDVDVEEDELHLDEETRNLTRTGNGSRRGQKTKDDSARLAVYAIRAARENPGCSKAQMAAAISQMYEAPALGGGRGDSRLKKAVEFAEQRGRMRVERGGIGRPDRHFESSPDLTTSTTSDHLHGGSPTTTSTPVYRGGGGGGTGGGTSELAWRRSVVEGNLVEVNLQTGETRDIVGVT